MIAPVPVGCAGCAFFLDIRDFATRGQFAVFVDDASAGQRGEAEKSNETHHKSPPSGESRSNFCTDELPMRFYTYRHGSLQSPVSSARVNSVAQDFSAVAL